MSKKGKKSPSPNDNRSNVMNNNNPARKASLNNHSRQLNPKDPKFVDKKGK
jgi:hypothetical protein